MVRPLYPPRKPPVSKVVQKKSIWDNPYAYIIGAAASIIILIVVIGIHLVSGSGKMDPGKSTGSSRGTSGGLFSFLNPSSRWKKSLNLDSDQELSGVGIPPEARSAFAGTKAENFRDKRLLYALQKYEGARKLASEREKSIAEFRAKRETPTSLRLKEAMESLDTLDNLGVMRLENLLHEELMSRGGKRENLDVLIFAFQNLAQIYEEKNMRQKAKESYANAFKLMKEQAPPEQGAAWDEAISNIENLVVTSPGN